MGKGYNNFMSKKAFHPGSHANRRRIHEAEEEAKTKRKQEEDKLAQYQREQELYNQRSLVSKESKDKLSLSFMYDAPPGLRKSDDKSNTQPEWKSPSSSKAGLLKQPIKSDPSKLENPGFSLEWKRDKLINKSAQDIKKQNLNEVKEEEKDATRKEIKQETQINLKWKREVPETRQKRESTDHNLSCNFKRTKTAR